MITVYQAFKIILGIVASVFILYFLLNYSGTYSQIQGTFQKNIIMKNFLDISNNIYLTGIHLNYSDFSRVKMNMYYRPKERILGFSGGSFSVRFPLLMRPAGKLYIYRNSLDYKWWKFYFVEAFPDMDVIFNPLEDDDDTWNFLIDVVGTFPSTSDTGPKVRFGFCDGNVISEMFERDYFRGLLQDAIHSSDIYFEECNATLSKRHTLVTISQDCDQYLTNNGICMKLPDKGIGYVFINSSDTAYVYKDPVDIVAMIIGGNEKGVFGVLAEDLFIHKNNMFRNEMLTATKIIGQRAMIVSRNMDIECRNRFLDFRNILVEVNRVLLDDEYYRNTGTIEKMRRLLEESEDKFNYLVDGGCEVL